MPGKQKSTYYVDQIDPTQCLAYSNVVVHCGINSIRKNNIRSRDDVKRVYEEFKFRLNLIRKFNKNCRLFVCPLLPTKLADYNRKANVFNSCIWNDLVNDAKLNIIVVCGFNSFCDEEGFLSNSLSSLRQNDVLHLNGKGKGQLAKLIKTTIFQSKGSKQGSSKLFSAVVSEGRAPT